MQVISSGLHLALTKLITKLYGMSWKKRHEIIYNTVALCFKKTTNEAASSFFLKSTKYLILSHRKMLFFFTHITCISNSLHLTLHTEINWWGHICYCLNKLYHESCKITAELYNYKKKKKKQLFRAVWGAFTCHVKTTQFSTLVYSLLSP